ncbi:hypothetical protein P167DRAFT_76742 [Morchella conica CCBAS932]|uniref:Uncharacterized protein n=1 Tax=Morchella conica CCBAS932 TaxID=1392247 RepID=A0A3N4KUG1_9PEZI|nr:hypothetical protein P167DRAFT_76742 [Morchella conica CCBAS932]
MVRSPSTVFSTVSISGSSLITYYYDQVLRVLGSNNNITEFLRTWLTRRKIQVTAYGIVTTRWCFCFCFFVFVSSVFEWLVGWLLGLHSWLLLDMVWTSIHFSADRFVLQLEMTGMGYGLALWR